MFACSGEVLGHQTESVPEGLPPFPQSHGVRPQHPRGGEKALRWPHGIEKQEGRHYEQGGGASQIVLAVHIRHGTSQGPQFAKLVTVVVGGGGGGGGGPSRVGTSCSGTRCSGAFCLGHSVWGISFGCVGEVVGGGWLGAWVLGCLDGRLVVWLGGWVGDWAVVWFCV